jgi:hypothetical protein
LSGVRTSDRFAALSDMGLVNPVFNPLSRRAFRRIRRANRRLGRAGLFGHRGPLGHHGVFGHRGMFGHHGPFGHYGLLGHYGPFGRTSRRRGLYRYGRRRRRFSRVPQILLGMLLLAIVAAIMSRRGENNQSQWW